MIAINPPKVIIIAGPNGAGKSTTAPFLLKEILEVFEFVNADVIASGLSGFNPQGAAMAAGRVMLNKLKMISSQKKSFAFESTLSGKSYLNFLKHLKNQGYEIQIYYLWLNSHKLAIHRVATRVKAGGHSIPKNTIVQRYYRSLHNFIHDYSKICDLWQVIDNTSKKGPELIARGNHKNHIINKTKWESFLNLANDKSYER